MKYSHNVNISQSVVRGKLYQLYYNEKQEPHRTVPNRQIGKMYAPNTQIHVRSLSYLGKGTSIKNGEVKLFSSAQICQLSEMMRAVSGSKMLTLIYSQANSVILKNAIILNIIHNIVDLRDTL